MMLLINPNMALDVFGYPACSALFAASNALFIRSMAQGLTTLDEAGVYGPKQKAAKCINVRETGNARDRKGAAVFAVN